MKFKRKIFIYIIMITLSLSVMFYGVYAAQNATLTISGKLAFVVHDCEGTAQILSVSGALNADGSPYVLHEDDLSSINWQDSDTLTLTNNLFLDDLSTRDPETGEFLDPNKKLAQIKITLKMTNTSYFPVKINAVDSAQLQTADETPENIAGITYSYDELNLTARDTEGASTDSFVITITPSNDITTLEVVTFSLSIEIFKNITN